MDVINSYKVSMDAKRRPTFPAALLEEQGIDPSHELVLRPGGPGQIIVEDPFAAFAAFQDDIAVELAARGETPESVVDSLFADRAVDRSLELGE